MADWAESCRQALQTGIGIWVQSAFLLSVGLTAGRLARRKGPLFEAAVYRASLCAVALSAFLAVALAGRIQPVWRIALPAHAAPRAALTPGVTRLTQAASSPQVSMPRKTADVPAPSFSAAPSRVLPSAAPVIPPSTVRVVRTPGGSAASPSIYEGAVAVWLMVCLGRIAWLLLGAVTLARIGAMGEAGQSGREADLLAELAGRAGVAVPRLVTHPRIGSPFVAGVFRPMIVVPETLADLDDPAVRAVLSHELAHVAQRDSAWLPAFKIALALAWPQPLLYVLYRRWLSVSEHACDVWAIGNGCSPRTYVECLVRMSEEKSRFRAAHALSLGLAPFRSLLGRRVQQILDGSGGRLRLVPRRSRYAMGVLAALIGGAAVFLVSSNSNAVSAGRRPVPPSAGTRIERTFPSPARRNALASRQRKSVAASRRGGSMKRIGSRVLSTVAAVTSGLVQVSLPSTAAPVPAAAPSAIASVPAAPPSATVSAPAALPSAPAPVPAALPSAIAPVPAGRRSAPAAEGLPPATAARAENATASAAVDPVVRIVPASALPGSPTVPALAASSTTAQSDPLSSDPTAETRPISPGEGVALAQADPFRRPETGLHEPSPASSGSIDMDFRHAPVDEVLGALFRRTGQSCSIPDGLSGTVTVEARSVSFPVALKMIMRSCSRPLSYKLEDGVYYFQSGK